MGASFPLCWLSSVTASVIGGIVGTDDVGSVLSIASSDCSGSFSLASCGVDGCSVESSGLGADNEAALST